MLNVDTSAIDGMEGLDPISKQQLKVQAIAQATAEHQSFMKEYNRYKQDCRKRALELATEPLRNPNVASKPPKEDIIKQADDYYNWLISIPQ